MRVICLRVQLSLQHLAETLGQSRLCIAGTLFALTAFLSSQHAHAAPKPDKTGYIPVQGGRVWYRINGANHACNTPLLAVHGGPGFSHHYMLPLTDLASERPIIFYDQLDSGNSDHPGDPANWTVDRFVSEVDAVRNALKLHRVVLLGSSWGGAVAAEYAVRQPSGLVALVLQSPLLNTKRWIVDNLGYRIELPKDIQKVLEENEAAGTTDSEDYKKAVMEFYRRHLNRMEPWPEELVHSFEVANMNLYATMWGKTEFTASGTLKDYDVTARLSRINVPTLFVCGEHDEATPTSCRDFSSLVPRATVKIIPGASHTAHLEKRDLFLQTVREFLTQVPIDPGCVSTSPLRRDN